MPKHIKLIARLVLLCSLLAIGFVFSTSQSTAHAQSRIPQSPALSANQTCNPDAGSFSDIFCIAPNVTALCSGQQFFSATDGFGNPIQWTFTDANNTCVHVNYTIPHSFSDCSVWFYVPVGNATATFSYTWTDASNVLHTMNQSIQEANISGWTKDPIIPNISDGIINFSFFDHQSDGGLQLGWGSNASHSLEVVCSTSAQP